jgi:hypothetical protein
MTRNSRIGLLILISALVAITPLKAQEVPEDYQEFLTILGKKGDYASNVLKANIPRSDLAVQIAGQATPTPFGFGGWLAFTRSSNDSVMSALLDHGIAVTALRNHFFYEEPRLFYKHVHGHGNAADLARAAKHALEPNWQEFTAACETDRCGQTGVRQRSSGKNRRTQRRYQWQRHQISRLAATTRTSRKWARPSTRVWGYLFCATTSQHSLLPLSSCARLLKSSKFTQTEGSTFLFSCSQPSPPTLAAFLNKRVG